MPPPDIIRAARLPQSRWPNDAGRKADIASGAGWLISFAWLERDAPFSDYAGHDRTITLLDGAGFALTLPEGAELTVDRPLIPIAFDGAGPIGCRLRAWGCVVLNVVTAYPGYAHTVQVLDGTELAAIEPGPRVFLTVLRGSVAVGPETVGERDTVRLAAPASLHASPDARVAVIRSEGDSDA
jgi:environmental stress-induced protein Ves